MKENLVKNEGVPRRVRLVKQFTMVLALWVVSGEIGQAVEVESVAKVRSIEWLWNHHSSIIFSPDGAFFLLAEQMTDGHNHLCVYDTTSLRRIKCIVKLYESRNSYAGELDWPDDRLFITAGGFDESFVGWLNIGGWQDVKFQEVDAKRTLQYVRDKEGTCPAWDQKDGGLYYGNGQPYGGVFFEKGGVQFTPFEKGVCAVPEEKYIWYMEQAQPVVALRRQNRATKKIQSIFDGSGANVVNGRHSSVADFSVSAKGYVLFVRSSSAYDAALYTYSDGRGVEGPVFGPAKDGTITSVRISPEGDHALVSVYDERNSTPGKNLHHIYMLKLQWSPQTREPAKN